LTVFDSAIFLRRSSVSWSPVIRPWILIRAIWSLRLPRSEKLPVAPASASRAAMNSTTELTRQNSKRRLRRRRSTISSASEIMPSGLLFCLGVLLGLADRRPEDVAERCAGIGGTILRDRRLLLGDLEGFDRHRNLAALGIDLGNPGIDLLADRKTFGPLFRAIARKVGALDECGHVRAGDLDVDSIFVDAGHLAGHGIALLDAGKLLHRIAADLLDAERDALLFDIDVEHLRLDLVALLVILDRLFARALPVEVGEMHHPVDIAVEPDEQAEFRDVLDFARHRRT